MGGLKSILDKWFRDDDDEPVKLSPRPNVDPFQYFLQIKPSIESDRSLMEKLSAYAATDIDAESPLPLIGCGNNHNVYRLGAVNGLWIATRERYFDRSSFRPELAYNNGRGDAEQNIGQAVEWYNEGKLVPSFVGGVHAAIALQSGQTFHRYFLLVEDLTANGTLKLKEAGFGEEGHIADSEVYFDFGESFDGDRHYPSSAWTFMAQPHTIELSIPLREPDKDKFFHSFLERSQLTNDEW